MQFIGQSGNTYDFIVGMLDTDIKPMMPSSGGLAVYCAFSVPNGIVPIEFGWSMNLYRDFYDYAEIDKTPPWDEGEARMRSFGATHFGFCEDSKLPWLSSDTMTRVSTACLDLRNACATCI